MVIVIVELLVRKHFTIYLPYLYMINQTDIHYLNSAQYTLALGSMSQLIIYTKPYESALLKSPCPLSANPMTFIG